MNSIFVKIKKNKTKQIFLSTQFLLKHKLKEKSHKIRPFINIIEWIHKFLMFGRTMFVQFVSCTETCFELIRFLFVFAKSHNFCSFVLMSDFLHSSSGWSLRTAVLKLGSISICVYANHIFAIYQRD